MRTLTALALAFTLASASAAAQQAATAAQRAERPTMHTLPEWARTRVPPPRRALVVGINQYDVASDLTAPPHDATLMARLLGANSFAVTRVSSNAHKYTELAAAITAFIATVQPGDIVIVYFSGHGMMRDRENYLLAADAKPPVPGRVFAGNYIPLSWVMQELQKHEPASLFIILDACRYDPFAEAPAGASASTLYEPVWPNDTDAFHGGLDEIGAAGANAVGLSAGKNQVAFSYVRGDQPERGSIYTRTLVEHLERQETLNEAFNATSNHVGRLTQERVRPVVLGAGAPNFAVVRSEADNAEQERRWLDTHARIVSTGHALQELQAYLDNSGASDFAVPARGEVARLSRSRALTTRAETGAQSKRLTQAIRASSALQGPLRFSSVGSEGAMPFAATTRPAQLVERRALDFMPFVGDRLIPDRVIAALPTGQELQIIDVDPERNLANVILPDGQVGAVRDVRLFAPRPLQRIELSYSGGDEIAPVANLSQLDTLTSRLARSTVRIVIGGGSNAASPSHASEIAYVRGQRLALELEDRGGDPPRIRVEISLEPALRDKAWVEVIAP